MPPLSNARHERFAQELAKGAPATVAYVTAGYKANDGNAIRLKGNERVKARITELVNIGVQAASKSIADIVRELELLGFSNMQDYMRSGVDGDPYLDFSTLTREQAAALTEVTVEDFKDGRGEDTRDVRRVKFKLADKRAALVELLKYKTLGQDKGAQQPQQHIHLHAQIDGSTAAERVFGMLDQVAGAKRSTET